GRGNLDVTLELVGRCRRAGGGGAGRARLVVVAPAPHGGQRDDDRERHDPLHAGSSTTTVVAFTDATASTPGARPSSSTASRDIRETTRWGPAWMSTWAITPSLRTAVTMPGKRLRAERATVVS